MILLATWIVASVLGLSALMHAFPQILAVLQLVGGAYLAWMGYGAIRNASNPDVPAASRVVHPFRLGVATNLSNPKAVLFFGAIFAQFSAGLPEALLLIGAGLAWFFRFALLAAKLAGFIGIAAWMIFSGAQSILLG